LDHFGPFKSGLNRGQREHESQRRIQKGHCAEACIPFCHPVILCVDYKRYSANLLRSEQAAPAGRQQKLATKALALRFAING
jgi:hypothetical protein